MNEQTPLKQDKTDDGTLLVHSVFHTIQGEGPLVGVPAVFVRLSGCNLQCPGCDTEYTNGSKRQKLAVIYGQVFEQFGRFGTHRGLHALSTRERPLVVLTGGEPFRQNIWGFMSLMVAQGYRVQVETNGTLFNPPSSDDLPYLRHITIVCSPKAGAINPRLIPYLTTLKYVARYGNICNVDGLPILALDHPAAPQVARPPARWDGPVYLQPMDEQDELRNQRNLAAAVHSCKKFGYTLCVQLHKIINEE